MSTPDQYRTKATEYASRAKTARSVSETREFQNLERVYRSLADNAEWLGSDFQETQPALVQDLSCGAALAEEEEQMLRCLGAAVMMRWDALPTKIQRQLFESATSIGELKETGEMKGQIARFLHLHKNGGRKRARLS